MSCKKVNVRKKEETITEPYASSVPRSGRLRHWRRVALALFVKLDCPVRANDQMEAFLDEQ